MGGRAPCAAAARLRRPHGTSAEATPLDRGCGRAALGNLPKRWSRLNPVGAFFVKLFMQAMIFMLLLPELFSISLGSAALFALVMSALSYAIGDFAVLRPLGRVPAALVDFALVAIALAIYPGAHPHPAGRILLTAAVVTAGEILLHNYLPHRHTHRI